MLVKVRHEAHGLGCGWWLKLEAYREAMLGEIIGGTENDPQIGRIDIRLV